MNEDITVSSGYTVSMSLDLLQDVVCVDYGKMIHEYMTYGQPRRHRNFMPEFIPFPRLKRAEESIRRTVSRFRDAVDAFKYGIPEPEC